MTPWRVFLAILGALSWAAFFAIMTRIWIENPVVMIALGPLPFWLISTMAMIFGLLAGLSLNGLLRERRWVIVVNKPQKPE